MNMQEMAELYILWTIDELEPATEKRIMATLKKKGVPYASIDEFLEEYEGAESITIALVDWIKNEWATGRRESPKQTAKQFAKAKVPDFLAAIE